MAQHTHNEISFNPSFHVLNPADAALVQVAPCVPLQQRGRFSDVMAQLESDALLHGAEFVGK